MASDHRSAQLASFSTEVNTRRDETASDYSLCPTRIEHFQLELTLNVMRRRPTYVQYSGLPRTISPKFYLSPPLAAHPTFKKLSPLESVTNLLTNYSSTYLPPRAEGSQNFISPGGR